MTTTDTTQPGAAPELKPCPFCGAAMKAPNAASCAHSGAGELYVICDCGAMGAGGKTISEAVAKWNRRATPTHAVGAPSPQPLIGKLLDEFSELPVLWGLNEPGALVRHSDVFKMLVTAGKTYLATPPASQACGAQVASVDTEVLHALVEKLNRAHGDLMQVPPQSTPYREGQVRYAGALSDLLGTIRAIATPTESAAAPDRSDKPAEMTQAARDVLAERRRQVEQEGWTPDGDDQYDSGELSLAASCYALAGDGPHASFPEDWPWSGDWWKPADDRRNLVKAGALILADIERLDRATQPTPSGKALPAQEGEK